MPRLPRVLALAALLALAPAACGSRAPATADGARMRARVAHQVAQGPRVPGTPGHEAVRAWLVAELTRLGGVVEEQRTVDSTLGRPVALTNVIARFGPEDGRRVLLCAHWDSRPMADQDPDPALRARPIPGANDGGSGVAVLLEVAEMLRARPAPLTVELAFFDGEDMGSAARPDQFSLGAHHYADLLAGRPPARRPVAAFLFDMVGDRDLQIHPEGVSAQRASSVVALVLQAARATGATHFHPDVRYSLTDDHIPLLDAGVPTADIIDFDYPAWHTVADDTSQVSAASLAEVGRVAGWLVYQSPLARGR
jgi:acetylornithine deacetylase/succinyl-diaminopimelate desuccinylase-like protein